MKSLPKIFSVILLSIGLWWSCSTAYPQEYEIDKPSPDGSFRVKVAVKRGEPGKTLDQAKFQFLIGQEVVDVWDFKQDDQWEHNFDILLPIQWIDKQVLNMGGRTNTAPYTDELIVTNKTSEYLKYVAISYGRFDLYRIFALAPGQQVTLRPNPWFTVPGGEFWFGYSALSQNGKRFVKSIKDGPRVETSGPKEFSITIVPEMFQ